jgi:hypothetical protein
MRSRVRRYEINVDCNIQTHAIGQIVPRVTPLASRYPFATKMQPCLVHRIKALRADWMWPVA